MFEALCDSPQSASPQNQGYPYERPTPQLALGTARPQNYQLEP